jgi:hypothetical protein
MTSAFGPACAGPLEANSHAQASANLCALNILSPILRRHFVARLSFLETLPLALPDYSIRPN